MNLVRHELPPLVELILTSFDAIPKISEAKLRQSYQNLRQVKIYIRSITNSEKSFLEKSKKNQAC